MKFKLSVHAKDVMDNRNIAEEWVVAVLDNPFVVIEIAKDEIHVYGTVKEYDERCLKVVVNPLKSLVIATYFDRKMKKKGCK